MEGQDNGREWKILPKAQLILDKYLAIFWGNSEMGNSLEEVPFLVLYTMLSVPPLP
jgi:hypothetical protein